MKFKCGPTPEEKAAEKRMQEHLGQLRLEAWHLYFAWWPTRVAPNDCRWMETIRRKGVYHVNYYSGKDYWFWKYSAAPGFGTTTLED